MRLSASLIVNYGNINLFSYTNQWKVRGGDPNTLYFQLIDLDQNSLRYLAGIGSSNQPFTIVVTIPSIDNSKVLQFTAIQADPNDSSIWKINVASTQFLNTGNVFFQVIEGSNTRNFKLMNALRVELPGQDGSC